MPDAKYWNHEQFIDLEALNSGGGIVTAEQSFTASAGQTLFTLTIGPYTIGANTLEVYINGVRQPTSAYIETSINSFTMKAGMEAGDFILARVYKFTASGAAHGSQHITGGGDTIPDATLTASGLMSASDKSSMGKFNDRQYFVQEGTPTASMAGDQWFKASTGVMSIWNGSTWIGLNTYN